MKKKIKDKIKLESILGNYNLSCGNCFYLLRLFSMWGCNCKWFNGLKWWQMLAKDRKLKVCKYFEYEKK